jgi:hypothetical protein
MIKDQLKELVDNWAVLGHPALLENFVLRNGKEFTPRKRIGRKRMMKECFKNAQEFVWENPETTYVEGWVVNSSLPFPIHHAWVTVTGKDAMDPTLDAKGHEYFGIAFNTRITHSQMLKNKVYGILDPGHGLNYELMFELDPELKTICERIRENGKAKRLSDQRMFSCS